MKIKLDENLYLESDDMQYILKKYSNKTYTNKDGEEIRAYQNLGYYGSIEQAINSLVNKKILNSDATSFIELKNELTKIWDEIKEKIDY